MRTNLANEHDPIWKWRWAYTSYVARLLNLFPEGTKVLEIGCANGQVVPNSDGMDILDYPGVNHSRFIKWDIRNTPWPINTKEYDVVLALEVWEHLHSHQIEAFGELRRITKCAIMSFPYKWEESELEDHLGIDEVIIDSWTAGYPPYISQIIVPPDKPGKHLVRMFNF